jgi:hypothetical protein
MEVHFASPNYYNSGTYETFKCDTRPLQLAIFLCIGVNS